MIEHLMSSSLSGGYQGYAAGFIRLQVRGLRSHQSLIARVEWPQLSAKSLRQIA
jgi:hypothetical protein